MKRLKSLNRQMAITMAGVTGLALVCMVVGMFLFYTYIYFPSLPPDVFENEPPDGFWPEPIEWAAFLTLWTLGLLGAVLVALRLANHLIQPLHSVATAARRIATGDLSARAQPTKTAFAETRLLIEDFNHMAAQLGRAEADMRTWHAAVAHELRTPLTVLRGQLQGYVDGVFEPDTPSLRNLLNQVEGLSRIVDDLKILTLAQTGRLELRFEPIDLAREIGSVVAVVRPLLRSEGVLIDCDLGSVIIKGDGTRIRQILMALLDNVRRHAGPGTVRIETRMTRDHAILRIRDHGPGLPPGIAGNVFRPFWRADESRSRATGGSGLGLAVVKAIAEAHSGTVRLTPSAPKGLTVEILFPVRS